MAYLVSVDVGSASVRAAVFDERGYRLSLCKQAIRQFRPQPDFVTQSSANIWAQMVSAVRGAVQASGVAPSEIVGLAFDATCSLVLVGPGQQLVSASPNGEPEQDIVMWMDHRAIAQAERLNATGHPALAFVGGKVSPEMQLPKLMWLKEQMPESYQQAEYFFDLADYLGFRCTGEPVRSLCTLGCKWNYLAHEERWPEDLLAAIGLDDLLARDCLRGDILAPGHSAGRLTAAVAAELGLAAGTPVATGIIDAHAGGLGCLGSEPNGLVIISGTSACHMICTDEMLPVPGVWGPYRDAMVPGKWLLEGGQSAVGALVDHVVQSHAAYPALVAQAEAEQVSLFDILNARVEALEADNPYLTKQFHTLGYHNGNRSPRANPHLRGMVSGLSLNRDLDDLCVHYLSAIQAVAYGTRHIIETLREHGVPVERIYLCGGGIHNPLWLREHADILQQEIVLPKEPEAVLLGTAMLAATASGLYDSLTAAMAAMASTGQGVQPRAETEVFHRAKYQIFHDMYQHQQRYAERMQSAFAD